MAEADVLEELRALEMRRAAGALSADDEERRAEILSGLEGEALRLERDLARTAARLRLIAEFLPPEAAGPALAAAGVPAEPLAAALESALAELAPPLPVSLPTAVLGEYDADLPPAPAPYLAPLPAPEAPVSLPPSPLAAMLTPEAALTPPVNDPLPPDAPADGEPTARLAPGDLPDAPPDAEPSAAPRAATDLGFDPSAEPPFPTTADEPAAGLSFDQGAYDKDLAACPGEPGAFEPALPAAASGEGEGEPLPAEEPVSLDVLAVQALAAAAYGAGEVLDDDFPEPEVEVVEAFGEPEPAAEVEETLGEPEPEVEEVEVEAPAAVAAEALEVAAVEPELVVEEVEERRPLRAHAFARSDRRRGRRAAR